MDARRFTSLIRSSIAARRAVFLDRWLGEGNHGMWGSSCHLYGDCALMRGDPDAAELRYLHSLETTRPRHRHLRRRLVDAPARPHRPGAPRAGARAVERALDLSADC
jgi:hypothetical protein